MKDTKMVTLEKNGAVKTLTNESMIAALLADGWVEVGKEEPKEEAPQPKRGRKPKGE